MNMLNKAVVTGMMQSFHKWGKTGRHSIVYKHTDKKSFRLLEDYLVQVTAKPSAAGYDLWYVKNHMAYSIRMAGKKHINQNDIIRMKELTYKFFEYIRKESHAATVAKATETRQTQVVS